MTFAKPLSVNLKYDNARLKECLQIRTERQECKGGNASHPFCQLKQHSAQHAMT